MCETSSVLKLYTFSNEKLTRRSVFFQALQCFLQHRYMPIVHFPVLTRWKQLLSQSSKHDI